MKTTNCVLEIKRLYKKYLKHCQKNNTKPLSIEILSIDMLNQIINNA